MSNHCATREKAGASCFWTRRYQALDGNYFMRKRKYCLHLLDKIDGSELLPGNIMGSSGSSILFKLKERDEVKTLPG